MNLTHAQKSQDLSHAGPSSAPPKTMRKSEQKPNRQDNREGTKGHVIPFRPEAPSVAETQKPKNRDVELLEEMNRKHAVVPMGSKVLVLTERFNPETKYREYPLSSFADLRKLYSNRLVAGQRVDEGEWWLNHPERRQYDGIIFSPGEDRPGYFNLWQGFAVEPKYGICSRFLAHIRNNICNDDLDLNRWVLAWMANAVQRPHERPGTALVLRGKQGTGKGIFARHFGALFGQHFRHISQQQHLTGNFNAHLQDCLLLFVDEGYWAGDKAGEGVLKALVTEPTLMIERKGVDAQPAQNYMRVIMASNNDWVVPAGPEERRFCVLNVADTYMQDRDYFGAIEEEMSNEGHEHLLHYLLDLDLSQFPDPARIPHTAALLDQKLHSMTPIQRWWHGRLREGVQTSNTTVWEPWVGTQALYEDFIDEAKQSGQSWRGTKEEFCRKLVTFCSGIARKKRPSEMVRYANASTRPWGYTFPPLDECQKAFEQIVGTRMDWPEEAQEQAPEKKGSKRRSK
jgi:hypothetical protein